MLPFSGTTDQIRRLGGCIYEEAQPSWPTLLMTSMTETDTWCCLKHGYKKSMFRGLKYRPNDAQSNVSDSSKLNLDLHCHVQHTCLCLAHWRSCNQLTAATSTRSASAPQEGSYALAGYNRQQENCSLFTCIMSEKRQAGSWPSLCPAPFSGAMLGSWPGSPLAASGPAGCPGNPVGPRPAGTMLPWSVLNSPDSLLSMPGS